MALIHRGRKITVECLRWPLFALFAYAGVAKAHDPSATAEFINAVVMLRVPSESIVVFGIAEIALGVWIASGIRTKVAAFVAANAFAVFAILHLFNSARAEPAPCGCLGSLPFMESIPPRGWFALNVVAATIAGTLSWLTNHAHRVGKGHRASSSNDTAPVAENAS